MIRRLPLLCLVLLAGCGPQDEVMLSALPGDPEEVVERFLVEYGEHVRRELVAAREAADRATPAERARTINAWRTRQELAFDRPILIEGPEAGRCRVQVVRTAPAAIDQVERPELTLVFELLETESTWRIERIVLVASADGPEVRLDPGGIR